MQRARGTVTGERNTPGAGLSPRMILIADAAWDAIVGAALIAPGNAAGSIVAISALIAFPAAAHPYVAALAVVGTGCAVFATLEYQAQRPEAG